MKQGRVPARDFKKGTLLLLLVPAVLHSPSRAAFPPSRGGGSKTVLRVRLLDRTGEVPREGVLLVGRSPLGSFPELLEILPIPPQVREVPFRFGRARISLPRGLPVALAWKGRRGWGWVGPFFGGESPLLRESRTSSLSLRVSFPGTARARLLLSTHPPRGTGASRTFLSTGTLPGEFRLDSLPPGRARFLLQVEGRCPQAGRVNLHEGECATLSLTPPRGAVLQGRILAPPGETLTARRAGFFLDGRPSPWTRADEKGRFRIEGIPVDGKAHRIEVAYPGRPPHLLWWAPLKEGQVRREEIHLPAPFLLEGKLLLPGGEPARGIPLAVLGRRLTSLGWTPWTVQGRTDTAGKWGLPVPPGRERAVLLVPSETGGPSGLLLTPPLLGKAGIDLGEIHLPLGTRLSGRIPGLSREEALLAKVELLPPPGSPVPRDLLRREAPLAPDGSFLFLGVGRGVHLLRAHAPGRAGIQRPVRVGAAPLEVHLALPRGLEIHGRVLLPGGRGAPGAKVLLEPLAEGWTSVVVLADSRGRFLARGIPPVPARVTASWKGDGAVWSARTLFSGKAEESLVILLFREP